jgi:hypothetical protein
MVHPGQRSFAAPAVNMFLLTWRHRVEEDSLVLTRRRTVKEVTMRMDVLSTRREVWASLKETCSCMNR